MSPLEFAIYFVLGTLCLLFIFGRKSGREGKKYPPGPWGFPIIGHLPMLGMRPERKIKEWEKIYGPVIAVNFGTFPAVIINDAKLIKAAFNEPEFSGRPPLKSFLDRSGGHARGVLFTEGSEWMEQRRFIIRTLRDFGFGKKSMEAIVQEEVKELIETFKKMMKTIGHYDSTENNFNAPVLNALWTLMAGERFKQDDPDLKVAIRHFTTSIQDTSFLAQLSIFIPIIADIAPNISGYNRLLAGMWPVIDFLRKPIDHHMATIQHRQPRDFLDVYLDEIWKTTDPKSSFYKENGKQSILFSTVDLFLAGAETTSTTLCWTFLYLAKYLHVQEKLHEEIDRVVGNSRLPSLSDRPDMPYTEALIHEVLRFSTFLPLGIIHSVTKDVEFAEYSIPKGTMIAANYHAVNSDERLWGDPENFRPERFFNKDGVFTKLDGFMAFSTGKRKCLGETLARDELFLFVTSLFQVFSIAPEGEVELSIDTKPSGVLSPLPHKLVFTERNV